MYSSIAKKKVYRNHDNCYYLGQFIREFFKNTRKSAYDALLKLDDNLLRTVKEKKYQK